MHFETFVTFVTFVTFPSDSLGAPSDLLGPPRDLLGPQFPCKILVKKRGKHGEILGIPSNSRERTGGVPPEGAGRGGPPRGHRLWRPCDRWLKATG